MNILIDDLSTILKERIGDIEFNTDFRIGLLFEMLMQDKKIPDKIKASQAINLYYQNPSQIKDYEKAIDDIIWFYSCRKSDYKQKNKKAENGVQKEIKIYDYEYDDEYIYSAFLQQYGIDLQDIKYLHWWKFKAMFNSLTDDTKIVEIMGYRAIDLNSIKDKEEKKRYKRLKNIYRLPDMRSEKEKQADFGSAFW